MYAVGFPSLRLLQHLCMVESLRDSTKKICRKLAGAAVGTATWQTNVGNEKGEVLLSVVTDSEALVSLQPMANGLMKRTNRCLSKIGVLCISIFILDTEMQDKIHR